MGDVEEVGELKGHQKIVFFKFTLFSSSSSFGHFAASDLSSSSLEHAATSTNFSGERRKERRLFCRRRRLLTYSHLPIGGAERWSSQTVKERVIQPARKQASKLAYVLAKPAKRRRWRRGGGERSVMLEICFFFFFFFHGRQTYVQTDCQISDLNLAGLACQA